MSTTPQTPDETPKQQIARKVITAKRRYFFPQHSLSVEAESQEAAQALVEAKLKEQKKEGDE